LRQETYLDNIKDDPRWNILAQDGSG